MDRSTNETNQDQPDSAPPPAPSQPQLLSIAAPPITIHHPSSSSTLLANTEMKTTQNDPASSSPLVTPPTRSATSPPFPPVVQDTNHHHKQSVVPREPPPQQQEPPTAPLHGFCTNIQFTTPSSSSNTAPAAPPLSSWSGAAPLSTNTTNTSNASTKPIPPPPATIPNPSVPSSGLQQEATAPRLPVPTTNTHTSISSSNTDGLTVALATTVTRPPTNKPNNNNNASGDTSTVPVPPPRSSSGGVPHVYHDMAHIPEPPVTTVLPSSSHTNPTTAAAVAHWVVRKKTGGVTQPFPEKLHEMLRHEATEDPASAIVSWLPHGRAFIVRRPKEFTTTIMPKYVCVCFILFLFVCLFCLRSVTTLVHTFSRDSLPHTFLHVHQSLGLFLFVSFDTQIFSANQINLLSTTIKLVWLSSHYPGCRCGSLLSRIVFARSALSQSTNGATKSQGHETQTTGRCQQ